VSFVAIILYVASQRFFTVIVVYFVIDSVSPETFRYTLVKSSGACKVELTLWMIREGLNLF
jgi:hypothetical protein